VNNILGFIILAILMGAWSTTL